MKKERQKVLRRLARFEEAVDCIMAGPFKEEPFRPEWMIEYYQGMSESHYCWVIMDGERHAIVKMKGHMAWTNRIAPWHWEPTTYELITKDQTVYRDPLRKEIGQGRLTKEMRKQFMKLLMEADRKKGRNHGKR